MYGGTVKDLNVYLGNRKVFSKSGAQGNEWKKAEVSISGQGNVRVNGSIQMRGKQLVFIFYFFTSFIFFLSLHLSGCFWPI